MARLFLFGKRRSGRPQIMSASPSAGKLRVVELRNPNLAFGVSLSRSRPEKVTGLPCPITDSCGIGANLLGLPGRYEEIVQYTVLPQVEDGSWGPRLVGGRHSEATGRRVRACLAQLEANPEPGDVAFQSAQEKVAGAFPRSQFGHASEESNWRARSSFDPTHGQGFVYALRAFLQASW